MSADFDFLAPTDKPALLGLSTPELEETSKNALDQLGYKVHTAVNHGEFLHKFAQVPYQVVILEEMFSAATPPENESLLALQRMAMGHFHTSHSAARGETEKKMMSARPT